MSTDFDALNDPDRASLPPTAISLQPIADDTATRIADLRARAAAAPTPLSRAAAHFELGMLYERELSDQEAANKQYLVAYNEAPSFRAPLFSLIRNYEWQQSVRNLERLYETEAQATDRPHEKASALVDKAMLLEDRHNDIAGAMALYEEALALDPACLIASLAFERTLRHARRVDDADVLVLERLDLIADSALLCALASEASLAAERRGDYVMSLTLARRALSAGQASTAISVNTAPLVGRCKELARRVGDVEALVELLTAEAESAHETMNAERLSEGDADPQAMEHATTAFAESARVLAEVEGGAERAIELYGRAIASATDGVALRYERLLLADASNDFVTVEDEADALLAYEPPAAERAALAFLRAEAALAAEDTDKARVFLARAIEADPAAIAARVLLEELDAQAGDDSRRLAELEHAINNDALDLRVRLDAALEMSSVLLNERGDFERAKEQLLRATTLSDSPGSVWRELYLAAVRADDAPSMVEAIEGLLQTELLPELRSAWTYEHWRLVREVLRQEERSMSLLARILEDASTRAWSIDIARLVAAEAGDFELLARAHTLRAETAHEPGVRAAHRVAACRALVRAGKFAESKDALRDVLAESDGLLYARSLLGLLLEREGDAVGAQSVFQEGDAPRHGEASSDLAFAAAAAAERRNDLEEAARVIEQALLADPDALSLWQALLRLAERRGDDMQRLRALSGIAQVEAAESTVSPVSLEIAEYKLICERDLAGAEAPLRAAIGDADVGLYASALALTELAPEHALRRVALERLAFHAVDDDAFAYTRMLAEDAMHAGDRATARSHTQELVMLDAEDVGVRLLSAWLVESESDRPETEVERLSALWELGTRTTDERMRDVLRVSALRGAATASSAEARALVDVFRAQARQDAPFAAFLETEGVVRGSSGLWSAALRERAQFTDAETAHDLEQQALRALVREKKASSAIEGLRAAVAADAEDYVAWDALRVAARDVEAWPDVVRACEALAEVASGDIRGQLFEEAGVVSLDRLHDEPKAESLFRRALELKPLRLLALSRLRTMLGERHDSSALQTLIEDATERTDDATELANLFYELAQLHRTTGAIVPCTEALENALMLDSNHIGALALAVETFVALGKFEEAVSALDQLATTELPATERRVARLGAADLLEHKLAAPDRALLMLQKLEQEGLADDVVVKRIAKLNSPASRRDAMPPAGSASVPPSSRSSAPPPVPRSAPPSRVRVPMPPTPPTPPAPPAPASAPPPTSPESSPQTLAHALSQASVSPTSPRSLRTLRQSALLSRRRDVEFVAVSALVAIGQATPEEERAASRLRAVLSSKPFPRVERAHVELLLGGLSPFVDALACLSSTYQRVEPATPPLERGEGRVFDDARIEFAERLGVAAWIARPLDAAWLGLVAASIASGRELSVDDRAYANDPFVRGLVAALLPEERARLNACNLNEASSAQSLSSVAARVHAACSFAAAVSSLDLTRAILKIVSPQDVRESLDGSPLARDVLSAWVSVAPQFFAQTASGV